MPFEEDLQKALKAESRKRPSSGIWYYVRLKDGWKLAAFPYADYPAEGHENFWQKYLVPQLTKEWNLPDGKKLMGAYRGMPRGRVDFSASKSGFEVAGEKPNHWYFFHGSDFPSGLIVNAEQSRLIDAFNLTGFAVRNMVEFKHADHETMLPEHERIVDEVLERKEST